MVRRLLMAPRLVMACRLAVMAGCMGMVFSSLFVMVGRFLRHSMVLYLQLQGFEVLKSNVLR
jgi:membrane protein YqaA with SNARE-associated domain